VLYLDAGLEVCATLQLAVTTRYKRNTPRKPYRLCQLTLYRSARSNQRDKPSCAIRVGIEPCVGTHASGQSDRGTVDHEGDCPALGLVERWPLRSIRCLYATGLNTSSLRIRKAQEARTPTGGSGVAVDVPNGRTVALVVDSVSVAAPAHFHSQNGTNNGQDSTTVVQAQPCRSSRLVRDERTSTPPIPIMEIKMQESPPVQLANTPFCPDPADHV
jgi:hypothetical protein